MLYFIALLSFSIEKAYAQKHMQPFTLDTSDRRIAYYRSLINSNENIVHFIDYSLQQNGIPIALRNLAMIESGFNNKALSITNAAGIWQLTTSHAITYGITGIERYDLLKSTRVAVQTISNMHRCYQDWRIVVAAYNCGEGNITKAIAKSTSFSYDDFAGYLPAETREHVYKFLLACYATGELEMVNIPKHCINRFSAKKANQVPIAYKEAVKTVSISGGFVLSVIAKRLQMQEELIRLLNPEFENELATTGATNLVLPIDKMPDFLLQKSEILRESLN